MNEPVHRLVVDSEPGPKANDVGADYVRVARAIAAICAVRILLLIAVLAGAGMWAYTIWMPETGRLYAAIAFSVAFLLPLVALFWKRG